MPRSLTSRGWRSFVPLLAIGILAGLVAAPVAAPNPVAVPASVIFLTSPPEADGRCNAAAYLQVPDVRGASSYSAEVFDTEPRINRAITVTGPPFPDDGPGDVGTPAGAGVHRWGLSGASGRNCADTANNFLSPSRWRIIRSEANFDTKPRIVGSTTEPDGKAVGGIRISISGASSASTRTNPGGMYSVEVKKGRHKVRAPDGFCAVGIKPCTNVQSVNVENGAKGANFVRKSAPLSVSGTVRDEFRRGLWGVRLSLTGPDSATDVTDAGGRYRLSVGKPGTYKLTATVAGRARGPYERYFVVKDGAATDRTETDVSLSEKTGAATIDWELDRQLQFSLATHDPARADGYSRTVATLRALTQHGDPAPSVQLLIDPPSNAMPRAVICSLGAGSRPLWPSVASDGTPTASGIPLGPDSTTNANGEVNFRVFPGTEPGPFRITGSRLTDDPRASSSFAQTILFLNTKSRTFTRDQLARALFESNIGFGFFGNQSVVFEALATRQLNDTDGLSGIDAVPVFAVDSDRRGILFYPRGAVPVHNPGSPRVLAPTDVGVVLDNTLLERVTGTPSLPTLREWSNGEIVGLDADDPRTYLGWPVPTTAGNGLGTCLNNRVRGEAMMFASHSPVDLLLTDRKGRRLGTDAAGKRHSSAPGTAQRKGGSTYLVVPRGAYKLTVTGTGSGPVTLESRHDGVTNVARFSARKGAKVTLRVPNGSLPRSFKFAGRRVTSVVGVPLVVKGLPQRLRAGRKKAIRATVKDAFGSPAAGATLRVTGAGRPLTLFADSKGRIKTTLLATKKGTVTFTVSAANLLPVRTRVRIAR